MTAINSVSESDVRPFKVRQFSEKYPAFSESALRYMIFSAQKNGLGDSGAIIRLGGRIYLDELPFLKWVKSGGTNG